MPALIRPKNIDPAVYLRYLYQKCETDIINEILRKRASGYVDYAETAALQRVQDELQGLVDESFVYVPKMIEKRFYDHPGASQGYSNAKSIIGGSQRVLMEQLADNLLGEITEAAAVAGITAGQLYKIARMDDDELRKAALSSTAYTEALGKGAATSAKLMEATIRNHGLTAYIDKSGRHWSLADYCNMATRTTARQAEVAAVLSKDEHDLYQIVKIGSTCPLCAVYEGRVYSKSGTSPYYPPLAMAFGKIDPAGGDDLSNTYLNIHPNCLHSLVKFTEVGKSEKQIEKIREFSSPETNPLNQDPRSKKQIEAYREKERNRAAKLRELRKKEVEQFTKQEKETIIASGARIVDQYSERAERFAKTFYPEIRARKTDVNKIAKNTGLKRKEIQSVKDYLFMQNSLYDEEIGKWRQFDPDFAIAQSWQRLTEGKAIEPHDMTLLRHELYEMQIKAENPHLSHEEAHSIASKRYDYQKEADAFYDNLKKHQTE